MLSDASSLTPLIDDIELLKVHEAFKDVCWQASRHVVTCMHAAPIDLGQPSAHHRGKDEQKIGKLFPTNELENLDGR